MTDGRALDALSLADLYAAIPAHNEAARPVPVEKGLVLEVPLRKAAGGWRILTCFVPVPPRHRIFLDELGASIYALCDGRTTVRALIERFAAEYKLSFHEARLSLMAYLRTLIQRGAIVVAMGGKA